MVSIPELTDSSNGKKPPCCPHWRSVFSSVFKELMLSVYTPTGIDTDPLIRNKCFLGASGNANGTPQPFTTRVSEKFSDFFVVPGKCYAETSKRWYEVLPLRTRTQRS